MISHAHRFLFVHVPKTGGNSIQGHLRQYSEDRIVAESAHQDGVERFEVRNDRWGLHKHASLAEYRAMMPAAQFNDLYKFAVIRNPWERMISFYFSPHRGVAEWDRESFAALAMEVPPIRAYIRLDSRPGRALDSDLDRLIRFENLNAEFEEICRELGLATVRLPRRNQSAREHYTAYYDDGLRELVAERFSDEIAYANYSFGAGA